MSLVVGEFGVKTLRINTQHNLTGHNSLTLAVKRPDGSVFSHSNPDLAVGVVDVVKDNTTTMQADEYVTYVIQDGDLTVPGDYLMTLMVGFPTPGRLVTVEKVIEVLA